MENVFGLAMIILAVIAITQTYRAHKFTRKVAIAQDAFKKPNIGIKLYDKEDIEPFFLALPLSKNRVMEVPLIFLVENNGEKSANKVEMFIRIPKELHYGGNAKFDIKGGRLKKANSEVVRETEYLHTIGINIETILPQQVIRLIDKLSVRSATSFKSKATATTKDNIKLVFSYGVDYTYIIDFILMQDNYKPISRRFKLSVIDISEMSIKEYFEQKNRIAIKDYKEKMRTKNIFKRILFYLNSSHPEKKIEKFYLLYCNQSKIQRGRKLPIDSVDSLIGCEGSRDIRGCWIPALGIK